MRKIAVTMLVFLLVICFIGTAHSAPLVVLDGREIIFDVPPTVEKDRILVPLRAVFEAIGAEVHWDEGTRTVTATKDDTRVTISLEGQSFINDSEVFLDVPAREINGRVMVPLRFAVEAFGYEAKTAHEGNVYIYSPGYSKNSALLYAAKDHNIVRIKQLLAQGADVNARDHDGGTTLSAVSFKGSLEIVNTLLAAGAYLEGRDDEGNTPLMFAAMGNNTEVVKLYLSLGANPNSRDKNDMTPLLNSVMFDSNREVVKALLSAGADPNAKNENGTTPLIMAVGSKDKEVVDLLIDSGADPNARDMSGETPLLQAGDWGYVRDNEYVVKKLLSSGADPNVKDKDGDTVLMKAAGAGRIGTMKALMVAGVDPHIKGSDGSSAFLMAARNGHTEAVRLLLTAGADPGEKDNKGNTGISLASNEGHTRVVETLLSAGADPNTRNNRGEPIVILAEELGFSEMKDLLERAGAKSLRKEVEVKDYLTYRDSDRSIKLKYPRGWNIKEYKDGGRLFLTLENNEDSFSVNINVTEKKVPLEDYTRQELYSLKKWESDRFYPAKVLESNPVTLANNPGYKVVYVRKSEENWSKVMHTWTIKGDKEYKFMFSCYDLAKYSSLIKIVQEMTDSLEM